MQAGCLPSLQCRPLHKHRTRYAAQSVYGYVEQSAHAQPADAPPRLKVLPRVQYRCAHCVRSMLDICTSETRLMLCSETLDDVDPRELSCLLEAVRRPREAWHSLPVHAQCAFIRQSGMHPGKHRATHHPAKPGSTAGRASQAAQLPAGWVDPQQLRQALQHSMAVVAAFVFEDKLPSYQLQQAASEVESASSSGKITVLHSLD